MGTVVSPEMTWPDAFLDEMRLAGDPPADNVVAKMSAAGGIYSIWDLMKKLVDNDQPPPEQLPDYVQEYLAATSAIPPVDPDVVAGGQELFAAHGPEMLIILAFYSLPSSYSARKGVQVLYRTGYLNNRPNHRLFETTQMIMDVMVPGGLNAQARGMRSAQKVRLMHAATRKLILGDPEKVWPPDLGTPINQEDLAGTLLAFSHIILDGLDKLGIETTARQQQGFLETWKVIGRLMGIREELIPADVAGARQLCERIQQRQVEICNEGRAMTNALLEMTNKAWLGAGRGWPAAFMRHFLPSEVVDGFAIPRNMFQESMLRRIVAEIRETSHQPGAQANQASPLRKISVAFLQAMVSFELGGKRTPFILPTNLHHGWAASRFPSVWQQLKRS